MSDIAIKAENVGKLYRLGQIGTGTISHDLNRWWAKMRGKEDPFAKIGETNDRTTKGGSEYVWALKDVNFEIKKGEAVGIIGRNGAGKSTLLKLLSKVTKPTSGSIKVNGRIASLLEVGTGFHPEMTGKENIYLNGAILGMTKNEISRKFDEIVDFSGVERYIDTPVKRYSSGMYVRLAFAVAAHLESEILIVDEVLAVGDAEFQKKCLGKMGDVSKSEGRTVLFVSHNMGAVKDLCLSGIFLKNGYIQNSGAVSSVIEQYLKGDGNNGLNKVIITGKTQITQVNILNYKNVDGEKFTHDDDIFIKIGVIIKDKNVVLNCTIKSDSFGRLFTDEIEINESCEIIGKIPSRFLYKGTYIIDISLYERNLALYDSIYDTIKFEIIDLPSKFIMYDNSDCGTISSPATWEIMK